MSVRILQGDVRAMLATLPDESVNCVITSPPYYGLRDYGVIGQLGLEATLAEHIETIVAVFREVRRVLRKDGVVWLNYGDCYASSVNGRSAADTKAAGNDDRTFRDKPFSTIAGKMKPKDRMMIPARVAIALHDDGWYLRDEVVWFKPNPMPSSVRDRTTPAHEMIYLLSRSARYFYDGEAIKEPMADSSVGRLTQATINEQTGGAKQDAFEAAGLNDRSGSRRPNEIVQALAARRGKNETTGDRRKVGFNERWDASEAHQRLNNQDEKLVAGEKWGARHEGWQAVKDSLGGRNKRSVWTVATEAFPEAHFATFPQALIEPMILAGCPKQCCAQCGAPWVRDVRRTQSGYLANGNRPAADERGVSETSALRGNGRDYKVATETLGWRATCKCNAATVPGVVLDPFGGSGTTGLVADKLGRNAILIELNPDYVALAARRIYGTLLAPLATTAYEQAAE